jgi:hypothetical protein
MTADEQRTARDRILARGRLHRSRILVPPALLPAPGEEWLALVDALRPRPA